MRWKRVDPECAARIILAARYGIETAAPAPIPLSQSQQSGVAIASAILREWGGVLLCDDVGLGKTHQAIALAAAEIDAGGAVAAIVPASLIPHWRAAARLALPRMPLISHSRIALNGPSILPATCTMLLVDEAHQFRNPHTRRYRALAIAASQRRLVLVTATPINNRARDLYALLRLFLGDRELERVGIPDLRASLLGASVDRSSLARIVDALVVRRTDRAPAAPNLRFPARAPPRVLHVPNDVPDFTAAACEYVAAAPLAPWRLADYGVPTAPDSSALVRASLCKRLDSSTAAFLSSLRRHDAWLLRFSDALAAGRLLRPAAAAHSDGDQLGFVLLDGEPVPKCVDVEGLRRAATEERADIRRLLALTSKELHKDVKLDALRTLLRDELRGEGVVVFTEYRETAAYLFRELCPEFRAALVHGAGARIASGPIPRAHALQLFAPLAQHAPSPPAHQRIQILIATDVLAEGLNLQDARVVISYDLPWNPVRLMQRIGRIDRLGSPHAEIASFSFAPHPRVDRALRLLATVERKIELIDDALPSARSVLPMDSARKTNDAAVVTDTSAVTNALRGLHAFATPTDERAHEASCEFPVVATLHTDGLTIPTAIVAWRSGGACWLESVDNAGQCRPLDMASVVLLRAALKESTVWAPCPREKELFQSFARQLRKSSQHEPAAPDAAAVAAGRRLLKLLAREKHPAEALCTRVDRLLARLAESVPFGPAIALRSALRASISAQDETAESACSRFEAVLPDHAGARSKRPEPLALLVFAPRTA